MRLETSAGANSARHVSVNSNLSAAVHAATHHTNRLVTSSTSARIVHPCDGTCNGGTLHVLAGTCRDERGAVLPKQSMRKGRPISMQLPRIRHGTHRVVYPRVSAQSRRGRTRIRGATRDLMFSTMKSVENDANIFCSYTAENSCAHVRWLVGALYHVLEGGRSRGAAGRLLHGWRADRREGMTYPAPTTWYAAAVMADR